MSNWEIIGRIAMKFSRTITMILGGVLICLVISPDWASSAQTAQGPFNLVAWDSGRYVQLNWDADFEIQTHGYNIYRSVKGPDNWEKLNEGVFQSTSFVDYSAPRSALVFYRVNYVEANGEEIASASVVGISTSVTDSLAQSEAALVYDKNNIIADAQLTNTGAIERDADSKLSKQSGECSRLITHPEEKQRRSVFTMTVRHTVSALMSCSLHCRKRKV